MSVSLACRQESDARPSMRFALLTVTYSGMFYSGPALSIEQQIRKARQLGYAGLAIETKRPVGFPLDVSKTDRIRIKSLAEDEGIELFAWRA